MKRWNKNKHTFVESAHIDTFLEEIGAVCRKHNLSIAHEDTEGAFIIEPFDENNLKWLQDAMICDLPPSRR